jgi:phytoene synthase
MISASFEHAAKLLRETDPDRYFATLVLPGDSRPYVTALYAFNADVAGIRDRVSGPAPGEIRLQWWSDALSGDGHGEVRQNPIADSLFETIEKFSLPTGTFLRLIGARRFDLYDDPMPDLETFEGYAGETASTLLQLSAMILNAGKPVETGDAAGHLGVAQALIGHIRALGYTSSQGRIMLPWSLLQANGVQETELFRGQGSEGVHEALSQMGEIAADHFAKAETAIAQLPAHLRPAFAIVTLLKRQLKQAIETTNAFAPPTDAQPWQKIAKLTYWAFRNRS